MNYADLEAWIVPACLFVGALGLGFLVQGFGLRKLTQLTARTKTDIDDLVVGALRRHVPFWFLLGGLTLAVRSSPLTPEHHTVVDRCTAALFVLSLSFVAANLITSLVERSTTRAGATFVSSSLMRNVLRGTILIVGGLMVLSNLGVRIEPLLTALGVGSLAVALALQPTLSNLFAGLHITLAKVFRIGDFIELENGLQGFVWDIGWRATKLRDPANNLVVVPNARLVEMVAKNYSLPDLAQSVSVPVGVGYATDLERAEAVLLEVAREVQRSAAEAVPDFEPVVRLTSLGDSSVNFSVALRVRSYTERGTVVHAFLRRVKARLDAEGIEIPFPQRVIHMGATGAKPA